MGLTKIEKETILNFNEQEDTASLYTCNEKLQKRFDQLALEHPTVVSRKKGQHGAVTYEFSKKPLILGFRTPMSEGKRQEYRERGKQNGIHTRRQT